jgi:GDSL/SGNH-like Acyl-Esterase family found in Pmr5 and Cas1p
MVDSSGSKRETLRLDKVDNSSENYRDADIIVFNSGHWWTHERTSKGYLSHELVL